MDVEKESSDPFERAVDSVGTCRQGNKPALVESNALLQVTNRDSEEVVEVGAFNPDLGISIAPEKTERAKVQAANVPLPRAAFDLTMAAPKLLLH